jgi:dTMP kinase
MKQARFITLEGIEGVGKSTQMAFMCDYLVRRGVDLLATREPGGTRLGECIRDLLLVRDLPAMHADTELLLMFAARAEHLQRVVLPALAANRWVVCDRFTDASYAYQGAGRGIAASRISMLEEWVQQGLRPQLTILLDADVETALSRTIARQTADRFERETYDFFVRVRKAYLDLAAREPQRFRVIDANGSLDNVRRQVQTVCDELMTAY